MEVDATEEITEEQIRAPIISHYNQNTTKFLMRGEISRLTHLPRESIYYYVKCSKWDQVLSRYQLEAGVKSRDFLEDSSVSQSAKGKRRNGETGVESGLGWPVEVRFKEIGEETAKISERERRKWVKLEQQRLEHEKREFENLENLDLQKDAKNGTIKPQTRASKDTPKDYANLAQAEDHAEQASNAPDSLSAEFSDEDEPRPLSSLLTRTLKVNDQRVSLLFEVYSVDDNSVTNSVGYGVYHIQPEAGYKRVRIPIQMPTMGFWQKVSARLTGALVEIPDRRRFVSELHSDQGSRFMTKVSTNGFLHLEFSVLRFDYGLHKKTGFMQTDMGLKEAFVRQKMERTL